MSPSADSERAQLVLSQAWEGMGLFAMAEGQVDRLLDRYRECIPAELRKMLLKRLNSDERQRVLRLYLQEHGLAAHYPDVCDLFGRVRGLRNRLAHGHLIYVAPDDDEGVLASPIAEGIGIVGTSGTGNIGINDVTEFRLGAERLVGLLNTLIYETGAPSGEAPRVDRGGFIVTPAGIRVQLTSPRQPTGYFKVP
jgi:hypothetical protein